MAMATRFESRGGGPGGGRRAQDDRVTRGCHDRLSGTWHGREVDMKTPKADGDGRASRPEAGSNAKTARVTAWMARAMTGSSVAPRRPGSSV
jgi:hypothetical protein